LFVKTLEKEFDYPSAMRTFIPSTAEVVAFRFRPSGGSYCSVPFQGTKIILSSAITPESRLMFERSIPGRVTKAVPFLAFDQDPYMVVSDDGRLFWMMDGYTQVAISHTPGDGAAG